MRPLRAIRARMRTARGRMRHRAEVRRGAAFAARADRTPVFILGAPRSGTTLLYQLLVEGLDVGWLANAHDRDPFDVVAIERREQPRAARAASDWTSEHGATREPWGPSESGAYWYRFVPRAPHQLERADATPARTRAIRASVRAFADACGAPVVYKNVFSSLRIPVLAAALPEARFIHIERDLEANARSLLAGRIRRGDPAAWWSAEPAGADAVRDASPGRQVVWQARQMNAVAHRELAQLEPDRSLDVTYDELCADPQALLERIRRWLVDGGSEVALRSGAVIPESFPVRGGGELPAEHEADLRDALAASDATSEDPA